MTDLATHKHDTLADVTAIIAAPITALFERRQAYGALMTLDDRMLEDIGLERGDMKRAVYGEAGTPMLGTLVALGKLIAAPVVALFEQRQAYGALMAMDDRMLEDIGLNRGDVERAVYGDENGTLIGKLIAAVKHGHERRAAVRALEALPDHLLADIGYERHMIASQLAGETAREDARIASLGHGPLPSLGRSAPAHPVAAQIARIDAGLRGEDRQADEKAAEAPVHDKIAA